MLLTLWNYIRGYVMIEVSGFSVERFMNLAVHRGIYIWSVTSEILSEEKNEEKDKTKHRKVKRRRLYSKRNEFVIIKKDFKKNNNDTPKNNDVIQNHDTSAISGILMKVSIKGFKQLRPCAKKTKCKIKIRKKYGLPFLLYKYRKRKFLAVGILFFVFSLYFLSSFIWLVQIEGSSRVNQIDIADFLKENGVYSGAFKYGVNKKQLEKKLLIQFPDISWASISINGTRAMVLLTEAKPKAEIIDKSIPCDIIAKKDGLITSIATSAGTPLVKPGDVVRAGDVLVSGELLIGNEETGISKAYVHAVSEIRAKMYYEMSFDVPLVYEVKEFTGRVKKEYAAILLDNTIKLSRTNVSNFENYEKIVGRNQLQFGMNYPLPFIFVTTEYREFITTQQERTVEQAESIGNETVTAKLLRELDFEADIIDKEVIFEQQGDNLRVTAYITTLERIDQIREYVLEYDSQDSHDSHDSIKQTKGEGSWSNSTKELSYQTQQTEL